MYDFLKEINGQGTTIILTTHYLEEAEALCRNIAIIDKGCILENTNKRALLQKLHLETFVLEVNQPLSYAPDLSPFACRLNQEGNLEVDLPRGESLNRIFEKLGTASIMVTSMRTRANRLEELFINLVEKSN